MSRLAALLTRRPWRVISVAIAVFLVAVVVGGPLTSNLTATGFEDPSAEFVAARDQLEAATGQNPGPGVVALVEPGADVRTGAGRAAVEKAAATIAADPDVAKVVTAYNGGGAALVSTDGDASYVAAFFRPISDDAAQDAAVRIRDAARRPARRHRRRRGDGRRGGRHDHRRGPRAGRDARVPDHLPALPVGLPRGDRRPAALADGGPGHLRLVPRDRAHQRGHGRCPCTPSTSRSA